MTSLQQQTRRTIQSQVRDDLEIGIGLLFNLAKAGEIMPPWWSKQRDIELVRFVQQSDHFQGAEWMISSKLTGVPFRVEARDRSIKRWVKLADEYQAILENLIQFGEGWGGLWSRCFADLWHTDNGFFAEVIGDGRPDGPLRGPPISIAHLDSLQCTRTSNPEYPVFYQDVSGKRYRLHHTRVIFASQQPSARANMYGVGHCWLTRAINNVQQLIDQDVYYQEALGSRPMREMLLGRGIDAGDMIDAVKRAEEGMDNRGLSRYAKTVFVGDRHRTDIGIDRIPFTLLPDGYDKQEQTTIAMFLIALAGGFPPRWLWPATQAGATKADAMWQHIGTSGAGALWHINLMKDLLSYTDRSLAISNILPPKFLPRELYIEFDYEDDEKDRQQAEIREKRASTRKTDIETGVVTVRVAREQALEAGDITQAQFNQMEMADGRLPDGASILSLFDSLDPVLMEMLDLGVDEPLLIDANDPIEMILAIEAAALEAQARMVQARSAGERAKAEQALEALGALKSLYEQIVEKEIEEEIAAEQQSGEFELPETFGEEAPEQAGEGEGPEAAEVEEKGFEFGARVGERIRGGLFRGRGGKFASEGDVSAIKNEMLSRLIARLRAKRGTGTGKGGKGAAKKPKKGGGGGKPKPSPAELARQKAEAERKARAEVWAGMDVDAGAMESLANFIGGADLDRATAETLAGLGFVQFDDMGQPQPTSAGRAIISAASKGDKRKAAEAASRGREQVAKIQARAEKKREQAAKAREKATDLQARAEDAMSEADELDDQADAEEDPDKAERIRERAEKKREQAQEMKARASEQDERAATLEADAAGIEASIGIGEVRPPTEEAPQEEAVEVEQQAQPDEQPPPAKPTAPTKPKPSGAPEPTSRGQAQPRDAQTQLLQAISDGGISGRMDPASLVQLATAGLIEQTADGIKLTAAGEDELKKKDIDGFTLNVRANIRGLWTGDFDQFDFVDGMISAIERGFDQAWNEGAAKCGIQPDERTPEEEVALRTVINEQFPHLPGFAVDIEAGSKANDGALQPFLDRGDLWIGRYNEVVTRAQAMACGDRKTKWVLGEAEHCPSCLKLSGKVKRNSFWNDRGILPRVAGADYLECHGFNCQCDLVETDEPVSRGPLPRLP